MAFSDSLKSCMEDKGVTAYRVAKDNNVSQQSVWNWLEGRAPQIDLAKRIADYFGKTLDEMMR